VRGEYNEEADGRDLLSRSLYSDFYTLVSFYLRRLGLLRAFGVESRTPLLDHRLVEYSTHVPSRLKIRQFSDTKYVYRRILEGVVPREILHDRPKLGHSVPMKNWLRDDPSLKEWFQDTLTSASFRNRGLFNVAFVERLLEEHAHKSHNHTHRLWGLMVLESWLGKHWDGARA
jgi:asparagine synthase (glutamine-hydrolysing)